MLTRALAVTLAVVAAALLMRASPAESSTPALLRHRAGHGASP